MKMGPVCRRTGGKCLTLLRCELGNHRVPAPITRTPLGMACQSCIDRMIDGLKPKAAD